MSFLKSINFHDQNSNMNADYLWLSRNIDFIYSCELVKKKIKTDRLSKVNIYLGPLARKWNGLPDQGIADIWVDSNAAQLTSNSVRFQSALMDAANNALGQVSGAGLLGAGVISDVANAVVSTGLKYEYRLHKPFHSVVTGHKFTLFLHTRFSKTLIFLKRSEGYPFRLLEFWPSPWIVLMKFISASLLSDDRFQVDFRYIPGDGEITRFGRPVISMDRSEFPVSMSLEGVSGENTSPAVARFTFDLSKVKRSG